MDGGAIFWDDVEPNLSDNEFEGNEALYGSEIGSISVALALIGETQTQESSSKAISVWRRLESYEIDAAPGHTIRESLVIGVIDNLRELLTRDEGTLIYMEIKETEDIYLLGTTKLLTENGKVEFTSIKLFGYAN